MNSRLRNYKRWIFIVMVLLCGIFYVGSSLMNDNGKPALKENNNQVHIWSSTSPKFVMNETDAEVNINNLKAMKKEGWRLFVQDGQPVSFNSKVSGRNEILEQSASSLLQGCYEISIDTDGNVTDIKPSGKAIKLLAEQQKQAKVEKEKQEQSEEQNEHDIQYNKIQNNIEDINRLMENGYRFKMSDDGTGTITTWNINNKNDTSPGLTYSIHKLMSYGISVKSTEEGKVVGFDFAQTNFLDDIFELYGMTE